MEKALVVVGLMFLAHGMAFAQLTGVMKATLRNGPRLEIEFLDQELDGPFVLGETVTMAKGDWYHLDSDSVSGPEDFFYVATGSITILTDSTIELDVRSKQVEFRYDERTRVCNEADRSSIDMLEPNEIVTVTAQFDSEFRLQILTDIQSGYMKVVAASQISLENPFCAFEEGSSG